MSDYVNKIKKGTSEYDIQDARVPQATALDEDKVIAVDDNGDFELKALPTIPTIPTPTALDENKVIKVDNQGEYALADETKELPAVETTDKDKYLHTNASTGALEWSEVQGGGEEQYEILDFSSNLSATMTDLINEIGFDKDVNTWENPLVLRCQFKYKQYSWDSVISTAVGTLKMYYQGSYYLEFKEDWNRTQISEWLKNFGDPDTTSVVNDFLKNNSNIYTAKAVELAYQGSIVNKGVVMVNSGNVMTMPPADDTKTYILKCVNGSIQWVEEA